MKTGKRFKLTKKKIIIMTAVILVLVIGVCAVIGYLMLNKKSDGSFSWGKGSGMMASMSTEGMIMASGVTSGGMSEESFEVENLTQGLLIEEVYVSSGDEVAENDAILKLSEDSVQEAREELEELLKEADLAYRTGTIEYEQNLITARYDRDEALLAGEQAEAVYQQTIASLEDSVESASEALAEAKEEIAEYEALIAGDDYYNTYKVGEYKALYDENLELLKQRMEEWGVSWSQVTSGQSGSFGSGNSGTSSFGSSSSGSLSADQSSMARGSVSGGDAGSTGSVSSDAGYVQVLSGLYSVLEQNLKDYEQAQEDYEDATANAKLNLQTLKLSLSSLEEALAQAQENYDTQVLQAKLTKETSLAEAERAESDYETAVEKAESDYETLKDTWEDALANLELFETSVGDGYYHVSGSGTIMNLRVRANQYLTANSVLFMYQNQEKVTVTVSVDQADIAGIEVGGAAYVESSDYGSFQGTVTAVNPISSSESRANVTYQVTVLLSGETTLPANETVTVLFGMGGNTDEKEN